MALEKLNAKASKGARKYTAHTTLKRMLKYRGLTYKDLGDAVGCSEATIRMKINGYSDFFVEELCTICKRFDLPTEIFFADFVS